MNGCAACLWPIKGGFADYIFTGTRIHAFVKFPFSRAAIFILFKRRMWELK